MYRKKRTKTRRILLIFLFLTGSPSPLTLYIGLPMVVIGQLVNILTYGILIKRHTLVTTGPYAWCRNPFYVGTLLTDYGFIVCCDPTRPFTLAVLAGYGIVQTIFYYQQMFREERHLGEIHGKEYEDYCRRVRWRLFPSLAAAMRYGGFSFRWSAGLALHNKIFSRATSAAFWVLAFWAVSIAGGGEGRYLLSFELDFWPVLSSGWILPAAAVAAACYVVFRLLEWNKRRRREAGDVEQALAGVECEE